MEYEWREVRKRGIGPSRSESKPVRQISQPKPWHLKPSGRRVDNWNGHARSWNSRIMTVEKDRPLGADNGCITLFFNNIPEDCSIDFLKRKFGSVKEPIDVFCPKKRDLKGRPFGFVRFENSEHVEQLLADLNTLWIGSYKIRVFKPRFDRAREDVGSLESGTKAQVQQKQVQTHNFRFSESKRKVGISFKEALSGKKTEQTMFDEAFHFQTTDFEKEWLLGAFTGYVKNEFLWEDIKEEINCECNGVLKVTSLGGNMVLIQSINDKPVDSNLADLGEWKSFWFQWSRPWKYVDVNHHRSVWTRWIGVPLHAWNPRFFNLVCAKFGLVLMIDEETRLRTKLDEAFVKISTGLNSVDRTIPCCIDGAKFQVRIEEVQNNISLPSKAERREEEEDSDSDWSWDDVSMSPAAAQIGLSEEEEEKEENVSDAQDKDASITARNINSVIFTPNEEPNDVKAAGGFPRDIPLEMPTSEVGQGEETQITAQNNGDCFNGPENSEKGKEKPDGPLLIQESNTVNEKAQEPSLCPSQSKDGTDLRGDPSSKSLNSSGQEDCFYSAAIVEGMESEVEGNATKLQDSVLIMDKELPNFGRTEQELEGRDSSNIGGFGDNQSSKLLEGLTKTKRDPTANRGNRRPDLNQRNRKSSKAQTKRKEKKKWEKFIAQIEEETEPGKEDERSMDLLTSSNSKMSDQDSLEEGLRIWNFRKKLGLTSELQDTEMAAILMSQTGEAKKSKELGVEAEGI